MAPPACVNVSDCASPTLVLNRSRVLLDANAVRDFFPRPVQRRVDPQRSRACITRAVAAGRVEVLCTSRLLEELTEFHSGHGEPALWSQVFHFFLTLTDGRGLRDEIERIQLELIVQRPLIDREAFLQLDVARMRTLGADTAVVHATHASQRQVKNSDLDEQAEMRRDTLSALEKTSSIWRQELAAAYLGDRHGLIDQYVRIRIADLVSANEVAEPGLLPDDVSVLRSVWFRQAFYVERARYVFFESMQRQAAGKSCIENTPDIYDAAHFCDASYADVLVTSDRRFAELAARTGLVTVLAFDDFIESLE